MQKKFKQYFKKINTPNTHPINPQISLTIGAAKLAFTDL